MALRVLTQVNYSAGENAAGDSGLRFLEGLLQHLVRRDTELHFYVLVPETDAEVWQKALSHPRITLIPLKLQPRLHGGDFRFDPQELYDRFDFRKYDVDILFLNQPETAPAFLQYFNRQTFHNVPAAAYVHWFDTRRPSTPKQRLHLPALLATLTGMVSSSVVGCNSAYGREAILKQAARWFNDEVVESLRQRIRILPPSIDARRLKPLAAKRRRRNVQIVINHRLLKYTGVRSLLTTVFPRLWSRRKDFRVVVTNPSLVRLPGVITDAQWLTIKTLSHPDYIQLLKESDIVVAPHRSTHWSMSTLEAICAECVPLMNVESFFPEMFHPIMDSLPEPVRTHLLNHWFYFRGNVVERLSSLIDNIDEERDFARIVARQARRIYDWRVWMDAWLSFFHEAEANIPAMDARNPSMVKIVDLLRCNGPISKGQILKELGWAPKQRTLSWTSFRKVLRNIAPDDSRKSEAVFRLPRGSAKV